MICLVGDPKVKTILNNKSQELKREIMKIKEEYFNSHISELRPDKDINYSSWKATRKIKSNQINVSNKKKNWTLA